MSKLKTRQLFLLLLLLPKSTSKFCAVRRWPFLRQYNTVPPSRPDRDSHALGDASNARKPEKRPKRKKEKKRHLRGGHNIPESFRAFCRIVSFTAAKTSRMLVVSVAWVRL